MIPKILRLAILASLCSTTLHAETSSQPPLKEVDSHNNVFSEDPEDWESNKR